MHNKLSFHTVLCLTFAALFTLWVGLTHAQTPTSDEAEATHADTEIEIDARARGEVDARDPDDDGDGVEDARGADSDDDGLDDGTEAAPAQSHNSSRSNRTEGANPDSASVEAEAHGRQNVQVQTGVTKEIDKASPKLMQRHDVDQSSPLLYQGISVRVPDNECPETGDCDDQDASVRPGSAEVRVSGAEVRGWSEEQKAEVRTRLESANEVNSTNDLGLRVASAALENENVVDIESDSERTEVTYNTRIRLFGFIPTTVQASARAEANGETRASYPWYAFLATKGGDRDTFTTLASDLRAEHDTLVAISVEEEGAPANRREDASDDSN